MNENLRDALRKLLNAHRRENTSDTADYILADYMLSCLEAYEKAVKARDKWFNFEPWKAIGARWGMPDDDSKQPDA